MKLICLLSVIRGAVRNSGLVAKLAATALFMAPMSSSIDAVSVQSDYRYGIDYEVLSNHDGDTLKIDIDPRPNWVVELDVRPPYMDAHEMNEDPTKAKKARDWTHEKLKEGYIRLMPAEGNVDTGEIPRYDRYDRALARVQFIGEDGKWHDLARAAMEDGVSPYYVKFQECPDDNLHAQYALAQARAIDGKRGHWKNNGWNHRQNEHFFRGHSERRISTARRFLQRVYSTFVN